MQNTIPKEMLRIETIQKELKNIFLRNRIADIAHAVFFCLFTIFVIIIFIPTLDEGADGYIAIGFFVLFSVATTLRVVLKIRKTLRKIDCLNLIFDVEKLVEFKENLYTSLPMQKPYSEFYSFFTLKSPYHLIFESGNVYTIPYGKNYRYCKMYNMDAKGVYNYSDIGDYFCIVSIPGFKCRGRREILLAYNTKLFEICA